MTIEHNIQNPISDMGSLVDFYFKDIEFTSMSTDTYSCLREILEEFGLEKTKTIINGWCTENGIFFLHWALLHHDLEPNNYCGQDFTRYCTFFVKAENWLKTLDITPSVC